MVNIPLQAIQSDLSNGPINQPTPMGLSASVYEPTNPPGKQIDDNITSMSSYHNFQFPLDIPKYYFKMQVAHYNRNSIMSVGSQQPFAFIYLPLPLQIMDRHDVKWEETQLGMGAGAVIDAGMQAYHDTDLHTKGKDLLDKAKNLDPAAASSFWASLTDEQKGVLAQFGIGSLTLLTELIGGSAVPAQNALAKVGVTTAALTMGISPNQFVTILMKGPSYKVLNFSWKLMPRNEKESNQIRKLIRFLNNCMAPGLMGGNLVFTFPKIFWLAYIPNSNFLVKFKPAALRTMQVNYTPGKIPAFYRGRYGAPESVEISMQFLELEYWLKNDFKDSFDPYDTYAGPGNYGQEIDMNDTE